MPHTPAVQVCPIAHERPHMPQLAVSVIVLTQAVPQRVWPVPQAIIPQTPAVQTWPVMQAVPHAPQLARSL